jgi:hypothetical protein
VLKPKGAAPAPAPTTAPTTAPPPGTPPNAPASPETAPQPTSSSGGPWKTVGYVAGGIGVVGLAVGGVFGFLAMSEKGSHCDSNKTCDPGTVDDLRTKASVSNVGLIAGGVLLAAGLTIVLVAPKGSQETAAKIRLAPSVGANGGGAVLSGSF